MAEPYDVFYENLESALAIMAELKADGWPQTLSTLRDLGTLLQCIGEAIEMVIYRNHLEATDDASVPV